MSAFLLFALALIACAGASLWWFAIRHRIQADADFQSSAVREEAIASHLWHPIGSRLKVGR